MTAQEFGTCPFQCINALKCKFGDTLSSSFSKVESTLGQDIFNLMVYKSGKYESIYDTLAIQVLCTTRFLSVQVASTIQRLFDIVCSSTVMSETPNPLIIMEDKEGPISFDLSQEYGKFYVFGMEGYGVKIYSKDTNIFVDFYKT